MTCSSMNEEGMIVEGEDENDIKQIIQSITPTVPSLHPSLHPPRFPRSSSERQNLIHSVNDINDGSPSRIRSVLRISLGMTTRPSSSMRRTMPVARMLIASFRLIIHSMARQVGLILAESGPRNEKKHLFRCIRERRPSLTEGTR